MSIVRGIPLEDEPGLGALTIPGYLRDVTARYADREALAMHTPDGIARWSYTTLWQKSMEVAKALIARDRKSVVSGKSVAGRVKSGGRRISKKKKTKKTKIQRYQ